MSINNYNNYGKQNKKERKIMKKYKYLNKHIRILKQKMKKFNFFKISLYKKE